MNGQSLHRRLLGKGLYVTVEDDEHVRISPASKLDKVDRRAIQRHKGELVAWLKSNKPTVRLRRPAVAGSDGSLAKFKLGAETIVVHRYAPSMGRVFDGRFCLDCETELIQGHRVPRLALASVSDGQRHFIVHPDDLAAFVLAHQDLRIVFHNCAFDFWVVHKRLKAEKQQEALAAWMDHLRHRRLHDTMLLDMLVRLATDSDNSPKFPPRNLGEVALEYVGIQLDKKNPYRKRFAELIGVDWSTVAPGFFKYAAADAVATARVYSRLRSLARKLMKKHGLKMEPQDVFTIDPEAITKFGVLTESVQVAGAIALARVSRYGMATDQVRLRQTVEEYKAKSDRLVRKLHRKYPGLFKLDSEGNFKLTKTGAPSRSDSALKEFLVKDVEKVSRKRGRPVEVPRTAKGNVRTAREVWEGIEEDAPFVKIWFEYEGTAKLCQFLGRLNKPVVRPRYSVLTRTGRTSCSSPNTQQVPRQDEFREVIVPSPGHVLLTIDYKYIELVTLAAVCRCRFGVSQLGKVIEQGVDPHCHTAALLLGKTYRNFMKLKETAPADFKRWRQLAKPVNFGVPGGLSPKTLVEYARGQFGVGMTMEEATEFHRRLVEEIYPELKLYLTDSRVEDLAFNLGTSPEQLKAVINRDGEGLAIVLGSLRKLLAGRAFKADGTPYNERYVEELWDIVNQLNQEERWAPALAARTGSEKLANRLFSGAVTTLTGRARTGVPYTAQRNTPFQGLAADGAKIAVSQLILAGYRVVGFIHDEVLVELPDKGRGYLLAKDVNNVVEIVRAGMAEVTYGYPVECEYTVATCWSKRAELIQKGKRIYAWRPPVRP